MSATALGLGLALPFRSASGFSPLSLFTGGVQGAWYDPSDPTTLFSDRAGTTPCGTPGGGSVVPVGLMLDKSQGLVLGSELVTNGGPGFTTTTGWGTTNATVTASGGKLVCAKTAPSPAVFWTLTTVVGTWYKIDIVWENVDATSPRILVNSSGGLSITTTNTTATVYFLAVAASTFVQMELGSGSNGTGTRIISLSAKTVAGNHAIAANDTTARPELRARVNLLTYSEQFDNAAWFKAGVTITAGGSQITAPDGTVTADLLTVNAGSSTKLIRTSSFPSVPAGTQLTGSVYLKAGTHNFFSISVTETTNGSIFAVATVNLATGLVTKTGTGGGGGAIIGTPTCAPVGNGWFRVSLTATYPSGTAAILWVYANSSATPTYNVGDYGAETWAAAGTETGYLWGAQLTATNEFPANTYQRISDADTYDAVGFPRYFVANGTSSAMSTPGNVNLSGTDKVTVFAGVRKTGAAGSTGFIAETSTAAESINGAFRYGVESGGAEYFPGSRGTVFQQVLIDNAAYLPPVTNVLQASFDIGAPSVSARVNGISIGTNTASQGTGNFGSYPLFIGSRNNSTFFLNGNIYSLIVVGSAVSAGQVEAAERWINSRMGNSFLPIDYNFLTTVAGDQLTTAAGDPLYTSPIYP